MNIWRECLINSLIEKHGNKCKICQQDFIEIAPPEIDHIKPVATGGENIFKNLQLVHSICNKKRPYGNRIINNKNSNAFNDLEKIKKERIIEIFNKNDKNSSKTAREVGMSRRQLNYFLDKNGISKGPRI